MLYKTIRNIIRLFFKGGVNIVLFFPLVINIISTFLGL